MMRRILVAYQVEVAKALRYKPTYLGPFLVIAAVLVTSVMRPPVRDGQSDYGFIALSTAQSLQVVGVLMILVYASGLIASELRNGSIRAMLTRPLLRHEYVLAKLLHAVTYACVLTLISGICTWVLAYAMGDLNGVTLGGDLLHTPGAMATAYLAGALLVMAPLSAAAAGALLISSLIRNPIAAAVMTLVGWFAMEILKYPLGLQAAAFSTYLDAPWALFVARVEGLPEAWEGTLVQAVLTSVPTMVAATVGTIAVLRHRNLG